MQRFSQTAALPGPYLTWREELPDDAATTVHLARYPLAATRIRVVSLVPARPLQAWARDRGGLDAIVGGFFVRPAGTPLGELWVGGRRIGSVPFSRPWAGRRSCVWVAGRAVRVAPLDELPGPRGDLVQAGPLLVRDGEIVVRDGEDPEGFSAGADQFDSDITAGRYPRAALALTEEEALAIVCDGRSAEDAGMTLPELAVTCAGLGARTAINLDGGGSASLVCGGRLRNRPREEHGIPIAGGRPIATALAFESA